MTSLSTRFFGHPRLTKPILVGPVEVLSGIEVAGRSTVTGLSDMQSINFNIHARRDPSRRAPCADEARLKNH